jgi:hypothetical protein
MIAGLPWTAWLLVLAAVGLGPALVIPFYLRHRPPPVDGDGPTTRRE